MGKDLQRSDLKRAIRSAVTMSPEIEAALARKDEVELALLCIEAARYVSSRDKIPMLTLASPDSTFCRVEREVKARSATTAIGSLRRRRASWISAPSFRKLRRTATGGV